MIYREALNKYNRKRYRDGYCFRHRELYKKRQAELRAAILDILGGKCACCGESNEEFLSIDHINGGGHRERMAKGNGGTYYRMLKEVDIKSKYRLLCMNCNFSIGIKGYCPHQNGSIAEPRSVTANQDGVNGHGLTPTLPGF